MDCPPGTPFGITAQKRTESGILEVFTGSNEAYSNGTKRPFTDLHTFGQTEETGDSDFNCGCQTIDRSLYKLSE